MKEGRQLVGHHVFKHSRNCLSPGFPPSNPPLHKPPFLLWLIMLTPPLRSSNLLPHWNKNIRHILHPVNRFVDQEETLSLSYVLATYSSRDLASWWRLLPQIKRKLTPQSTLSLYPPQTLLLPTKLNFLCYYCLCSFQITEITANSDYTFIFSDTSH